MITKANADDRVDVVDEGAVFQRDGEIIDVGRYSDLRERYTADEEIGSAQHVVMPGLVNAHHHVGLTPLQLGTLDASLEPWITDRIGKRQADPYLDTMWGAIKMIESGITTVMHNDTSIVGSEPLLRSLRVLQAYEDAGMRAAFSVFYREQNRLVYEDDETFLRTVPEAIADPIRRGLASSAMSNETYLSLFEELHERYGRDSASRIRILLAPGNVQWCSDDFLRQVKTYAARFQTGIHIHLLESPYQKLYALRTWGRTPVQHLHDIEFLGPEVSCAHSVWLTDGDMALLAESGATVCHNPSSNLRLKSGIAPVNRMTAAGVPVAIGIDEATINDDNDMLLEMRLAAKLHREPGVDAPQPDSADVLHMATRAGAQATCFGESIGSLEPGKRADVVLLRLDRIEEPYLDPVVSVVDAVVYRGRALDVDTVLVDGNVLFRDGQFVTIDRERIVEEIHASLSREATPQEIAQREQWEQLVPYVNDFYSQWKLEDGAPHYISNQVR